MAPVVHVRDADPEDAEAVAAVARESWHAAYGGVLSADAIDATVDEWYDPGRLRRHIASDGAFLVAEADAGGDGERAVSGGDGERTDATASGSDDRPLGFAHARYADGVGNVVLRRIYVRPDAWGEGVGTALLRAVAARFGDDHDRISAVVLADNEVGRSFYDSLGFETVGSQTTTFGGEEREERIVAADLDALVGDDQ
ncbi:GNAT family N-acetyltransferase [Halobaculum sp. CBA1158]|uniref:GNAT family N-acetyltransferase n=1 Tax=Halobaculum sp. CBA1158 TaxID=2904243 RepID=UPI001F371ED8|nr:GNAT family N-acetyltransferase [Halobaculum sp. CBA1158]UIO99117.1 GNAT family N-acetyltransferase [Halobaculum sp. CBA1158]